MEERIQLKHPAGKHAVSISKEKYEVMAEAILHSLKEYEELTHKELLQVVMDYFRRKKQNFKALWNGTWNLLSWIWKQIKLSKELPAKEFRNISM